MKSYLDIFALRDWDLTILKRYTPVFSKSDKTCHLCALGPCKPRPSLGTDLESVPKGELGKCGIDETGFKARVGLLDAVIGASGHASHAARLIEDLTAQYGKDCIIDGGPHTSMPTPITTLITGFKPKNIGELKDILNYIEGQLTHLLSSINFGTEASPEDFVSKALHAGMLDNLAMEIADIAQMSAMNMPKGESDSPIVAIGMETVDTSKPVILIVGHNSSVAHEIMRIMEQQGFQNRVEVCGLCCAASDASRHSHGHGFKIIGNQAAQLSIVQSGIADVIVLDTQCIRADVVSEAKRVNSFIIATTQETALGLDDLTNVPMNKALEHILNSGSGIILDKNRAAEAAVKLAISSQQSAVRNRKEVERMRGLENEKKGSTPQPPNPSISGLLRVGRGLIRDSEIRGIAPAIVMGEVPGIIGIFGCPEEKSSEFGVQSSGSETKKIAEEFLKRGYIVSTGGCASMDLAKSDLFKNNPDSFDSANLTNLGSCVSAAHLIGACIKIAQIMCHRKLESNYKEIADYIINRVGAAVILWGSFAQKTFSTGLGMARLGIPVIFGPRFKNYGIYLLGKDAEWRVRDARLGDMVIAGPAPQNLLCFAEKEEDALLLAAKLCMRPNDTSQGRKTKLRNYAGIYMRDKKELPSDINLFVRTNYDIPEEFEQEIRRLLHIKAWQPACIPDPTIL